MASFVRGPGAYVELSSLSLTSMAVICAATLAATTLLLAAFCWRLGKCLGLLIFLIYAGTVGMSILWEARIFLPIGYTCGT